MASPGSFSYLDAAREDPSRMNLSPGFPFVRSASGTSTPLLGRTPSHDARLPQDDAERLQRDDEGGRTQVFVGNLPFRVRWQDLKDLFRNAGPHHLNILRADVSLLPDNRSKGSGTVLFASRSDALRAIEAYNGYNWQGRLLDVHFDTQDPTGAMAIANAQQAPQQSSQMIPMPMMMHFVPQAPGSSWPSPAGQSATLPGKATHSTMSTSPPVSSSRPSSSAGAAGITPATSPGEKNVPTPDPPVSIALTSASGATIQMPAGFPQGVAMVPVPFMISQGGGQNGPQMFAMPQMMQSGNFMYYTPQGFRPNAGVPPGYQNRHLFVGNLPFNCQWQDLKDLFRTAGHILRADITTGPDGRSRGFGTVLFATTEDAQNAVRMLNGYEYNGRILKVHFDKFAGQQHPSQGVQGQPSLQHRSSAPTLPTSGMAPPLQHTNSSDYMHQLNGYHDQYHRSNAMRRDGSAHSAIPANEEANRPMLPRHGASAPHMPSVHGAIHPPHALAFSAASEPTQILGPSALMSPGPGQTGDMQAFAAAAAHYAEQQRQFSAHGLPMHGSSHLRQSTLVDEEHATQEGQADHTSMKPMDEHPGPLHVQIPPPPFFGPLSPQQNRGVAMTPSMPGFSFHPFPQTPPLMPQFLSPGLGPYSPPLGHTPPAAYAAPGMPMHYAMGTPTSADGSGYGPGYFPSLSSVMANAPIMESHEEHVPPSTSSSETEGTVVEAPQDHSAPSSAPDSAEKSKTPSHLDGHVFHHSALAARRASNSSVRNRAEATLGLLPSALDSTSPMMHAVSPGSAQRSDGSDELSNKVSRLDIGPAVDDPSHSLRRASFLEGGLPGSHASSDLRRRLEGEEADGPPRRSSFDGAPPENKAAKLKRFGASIWQV